MFQVTISKPMHRVLSSLTGENRADVALELAAKDLVRLKLKDAEEQIRHFQTHYGMDFAVFKEAWHAGKIANKHTYEVEKDYWEWESAVEDDKKLRQLLDELL
jgi:hypothetical protein